MNIQNSKNFKILSLKNLSLKELKVFLAFCFLTKFSPLFISISKFYLKNFLRTFLNLNLSRQTLAKIEKSLVEKGLIEKKTDFVQKRKVNYYRVVLFSPPS